MFLAGRQFVFRVNSFDRTFGLAQCAVDTLFGIDNKKIRAFVEAVHGADLDAVGQFALDAGFGDDKSHAGYLAFRTA
jgi:hypothetical protein